LHQNGSGIYGKEDLVRLREGVFVPLGEVHGRRVVDDQMATQVGLLLVLLDEKLVGAGVEFPVDVADRLAGVVRPVLGEFHGKTVHGALVDTRDKTFHDLFGHELHVVELSDLRQVNRICHIVYFSGRKGTIF